MRGYCCLNDTAHRPSQSTSHHHITTIVGLDGATLWIGLLGHQTSHQRTSSYGSTVKPVDSDDGIIARIVKAAQTIRQQTGIFVCSRHFLPRRCRLCIEVGVRTFEHGLQIGTLYNFPSEYFSGFARFPTLIRPTLMI
jgi:hypothetical protein